MCPKFLVFNVSPSHTSMKKILAIVCDFRSFKVRQKLIQFNLFLLKQGADMGMEKIGESKIPNLKNLAKICAVFRKILNLFSENPR